MAADDNREQQTPEDVDVPSREADVPADEPDSGTAERSSRAHEPRPRTHDPQQKGSDGAVGAHPALLKLHSALKDLDQALFEARRALDVTLDRAPESKPPPDLPYKELRRLAEHLRDTGRRTDAPTRARISELLESRDGDGEPDDDRRLRAIVGVAPSGKLRGD